MGLKNKLAIILLVSLFSVFPARANAQTVSDIAKQLMCACGCGLVLATCDCDLPDGAAEMNALIAQKLAQGQSAEQITQFFVARYGQRVLVSPKQNSNPVLGQPVQTSPKQGSNPVLWSATLLGILAVGTVIYLTQKKRTQKKRARRK